MVIIESLFQDPTPLKKTKQNKAHTHTENIFLTTWDIMKPQVSFVLLNHIMGWDT